VHILTTAQLFGGTGINCPYVHQPRIEFYNNNVYVYFEEVRSATDISSWRLTQAASLELPDGSLAIPDVDLADALRELAVLGTP